MSISPISVETLFRNKHLEAMMQELDFDKSGIAPNQLLTNTGIKVWWKCSKGHSWENRLKDRINKFSRCPFCSNHKAWPGFNDLLTFYPEIAAEWDYEKNGDLRPENVTKSSGRTVFWKCKRGHEWRASVCGRTQNRSVCPECSKGMKTSFAEQAIFYYVSEVYSDAENGNRVVLDGKELDIFIPSLKVGIEHDGVYYHTGKKDKVKDEICKQKGIILFRIREKGCETINADDKDSTFVYDPHSIDELEDAIKWVLKRISKTVPDINIRRDEIKIREKCLDYSFEHSLTKMYPSVAEDWLYEKNGNVKPEGIDAGSHMNAWWKCKTCGGEWQMRVGARTFQNEGCPYCAGKKALKGYNDFASQKTDLLKYWDFDKNAVLPGNIPKGYTLKISWICPVCRNQWKATIKNMEKSIGGWNNGCRKCSGNKVILGENDFASSNPELIKEWDNEKNPSYMSPENYAKNSYKKVWWRCAKGHSYQATMADRTSGRGCPFCWGRKAWPGDNDLATRFPNIAKEWHPTKNGDLQASEVTWGSGKKVWWLCPKGHEYCETVTHRTNMNCGCPYCSGNKVLAGFNDIATTDPAILDIWDYERNTILPTDVSRGSAQKVFWRCVNCGYSWKTSVNIITSGHGCPKCAKKKQGNRKVPAENLIINHPELLAEWDYEHNLEVNLETISIGSHKKCFWKCKEGHVWKASPNNRTSNKSTCPICKKENKNTVNHERKDTSLGKD